MLSFPSPNTPFFKFVFQWADIDATDPIYSELNSGHKALLHRVPHHGDQGHRSVEFALSQMIERQKRKKVRAALKAHDEMKTKYDAARGLQGDVNAKSTESITGDQSSFGLFMNAGVGEGNTSVVLPAALSIVNESVCSNEVFDAIDTDKNGALSQSEVLAYLGKQHGLKVAREFFRVLNVNGDSEISREEWHHAWARADVIIKRDKDRKEELTFLPPPHRSPALLTSLSYHCVTAPDHPHPISACVVSVRVTIFLLRFRRKRMNRR